MFSYQEARQAVIREVTALGKTTGVGQAALREALGFVLAGEVLADRDYPPFHRSTRDGYAVRAPEAQAGAALPCVGEWKAGDASTTPLAAGTCVQIMTGAGAPPGADAVVMIEHTEREGERVKFLRSAVARQNIVSQGSEARAGQALLRPGQRLGFAEIGLAAQVGAVQVAVHAKPRVAILSTGDEIVSAEKTPGPFQIRNSNNFSLGAQVHTAGGVEVSLGNAADRMEAIRAKIEEGLRCDALVISGGVSMGKYDLVEPALRELGAQFHFDAVAIRPGKPAVFATCQGKPVFGLPGNPVSTMVTFELFAAPALDILSGAPARPLPLLRARLAETVRQSAGLTHFTPARIAWVEGEPVVRELRWRGSGDIAALGQANCFLVMDGDKGEMAAGEWAMVLPRRDVL
jgi:molybdopterin molybdotransferase